MTERHFLFDSIPFEADISILSESIFFHGDPESPRIHELWAQGLELARPKAIILPVDVVHDEAGHVVSVGGQATSSVILDRNFEGLYRAFAYVATCGCEFSRLSAEDDDEKSALFIMRLSAVQFALKYALDRIAQQFGISKYAVVSPGSLPQWPISEQPKLFDMIGCVGETIGVELENHRFMHPAESVSGLMYETQHDYKNCMLCRRENCVGRSAEYDPELAEKYR